MNNTAKLSLFKIMYEGSVASGVRRIEAITGRNTINGFNSSITMIGEAAEVLKINNPKEIVEGSRQLMEHIKDKDAEIAELKNKLAVFAVDDLFKNSVIENDVRIMTNIFNDSTPEVLRTMCERVNDIAPKAVLVAACVNGGKATIACAVGTQARARGLKAGNI